jgi:hypothetical protein
MPPRDIHHAAVKSALVKEGWVITDDPLILAFGHRNVFVDLGAELLFAAERNGERIAVEVKSFLGVSTMKELEQALGQYRLYRFLLAKDDPERQLFLALTQQAFADIFSHAEGRELMRSEELKLLVFDPNREVVLQWI